MAIKISGTTVIDDSRNIKNVTNMYQGTSDGSDTSLVTINGGGGGPNWSRGAGVSVYGNEHASEPGLAWLYGGNVTGSEVRIAAGGSTRLSINGDTGAWNINSVSNPGSAGQVLTSQGSGAPPGWASAGMGEPAYSTDVTSSYYTTKLTLSHGLGRDPYHVNVYLECVSAAQGYSVGDRIPLSYDNWQQSYGVKYDFNSSTISVYLFQSAIPIKGSSSYYSYFYLSSNLASFKLVVEAW